MGRYVCVRMCDGAVVSLARRPETGEGSPRMPSCDNACPGADTRLYTLNVSGDDINNATDAENKTSYAELAARVKAASGQTKTACACGSVAAKQDVDVDEFFADATLRNGDVVATTEGLRIFHGGRRLPHKGGEFLAFDAMRGRMARSTHWRARRDQPDPENGKSERRRIAGSGFAAPHGPVAGKRQQGKDARRPR